MARTLNGKCIGRAARTEHLDMLERLGERRRTFNDKYLTALARLQQLDLEWEVWYDSRPEKTCGEMLPLIEQRILEHEGAATRPE